jgi:hypothetical protein
MCGPLDGKSLRTLVAGIAVFHGALRESDFLCAMPESAALDEMRGGPDPGLEGHHLNGRAAAPGTENPDMTDTRPARLDPGVTAGRSGDRLRHFPGNRRRTPVVRAHRGLRVVGELC